MPIECKIFLWATFLHSLRLHILIFDKTIKSWNINFLQKQQCIKYIDLLLTSKKQRLAKL